MASLHAHTQGPLPRLRRVAAAAAALWLCYLLPAAVTACMLVLAARTPGRLVDLQLGFLRASRAVAGGRSPYPPVTHALLHSGEAFVYPPPVAWLLVPLTWLPAWASSLLVTALIVAALAGALWLLEVRDPRCYGIVALWHPVIATEVTGALSAFLALAVAVAWRCRRRTAGAGLAVAAAVTAKLFLWPLGLWLLLSGRRRSLAVAAGASAGAVLAAWAALGFAGLAAYPHLLGALSALESPQGYTVPALLHRLGAPMEAARALCFAAVAALAAWAHGRRGQAHGERLAFKLAIVASLLLTPIAWAHYFVLLLPLCALSAPRLAPIWLLPLLPWALAPQQKPQGSLAALAGYLAVFALTAWLSLRAQRRPSAWPGRSRAGSAAGQVE